MSPQSKISFFNRAHFNALLLLQQLIVFKRRELKRAQSDLLEKLSKPSLSVSRKLLVDRVEHLDVADFRRRYYSLSKPVVFSGAASDWPCVGKWSLDFFAERYGQHDLLFVDSQGLTTQEESRGFEFVRMREFVEGIRAGHERYLRFSPLLKQIPDLFLDLDLDWLFRRRSAFSFGNDFHLFIGGRGRKTFLHADQPCNLFVQVAGEKKWTLFPPQDTACLYPELTDTAYLKSPISADAPDLERYPLFAKACRYEAVLKAGDVLYVPPHVWHEVENLTDSIGVGFRFSSLRAALKSSVTLTALRILSNRPPLWKTRAYGRIDTNLIWAHANHRIDEVWRERERRQEQVSP